MSCSTLADTPTRSLLMLLISQLKTCFPKLTSLLGVFFHLQGNTSNSCTKYFGALHECFPVSLASSNSLLSFPTWSEGQCCAYWILAQQYRNSRYQFHYHLSFAIIMPKKPFNTQCHKKPSIFFGFTLDFHSCRQVDLGWAWLSWIISCRLNPDLFHMAFLFLGPWTTCSLTFSW